ncbi:MAG: cytochrome c biogenesis protein CcdA [Nanoarchaeota archaeon]
MRHFFFFLSFFLLIASPLFARAETTVTVYRSESCGHCVTYLTEFKEFLSEQQITSVVEKDIIRDTEALRELDSLTRERKIPYDLQGHMVIVINALVLEGHVPISVLEDLFTRYPDYNFPSLVLFQDSMDLFVSEYKILDDGDVKNCSTDNSLLSCQEQSREQKEVWETSFFLLVAFNALLAGIHPCTLTVLLFFIAFLLTLHTARLKIVRVGIAYIVGIFLAYLGIGIGIFKAVSFTGSPHFAAKVGAVLILLLGVLNLLSFFFPGKIFLGLPRFIKPTLARLLERATVPTVFIVGLLVGICSFGCTAGIYLSVISLLLVQSQYLSGLFYLLLYNIMFVLPLIVVLIFASHKRVVVRLEKLEIAQQRLLKLFSGIVMILLALFLFWLTRGGA